MKSVKEDVAGTGNIYFEHFICLGFFCFKKYYICEIKCSHLQQKKVFNMYSYINLTHPTYGNTVQKSFVTTDALFGFVFIYLVGKKETKGSMNHTSLSLFAYCTFNKLHFLFDE